MPESSHLPSAAELRPQPLYDDGRSSCIGPSKFWRVHENMNGFLLEPIPNRAKVAVSMGGVITLSSLATVYFLELPWFVAILGLVGGGMAMFIMHTLMKGEIDRGAYLIHHADSDEIELPRYGVRIPRQGCECVVLRMWPHRTVDGPRTCGELIFHLSHVEHAGYYMTVISQHLSDARALAEDVALRLKVEVFEIPYERESQPEVAGV